MIEKRKTNKKPVPPAASAGPMDVRLLEQIVKLMAANDLGTVDIRDGERRIMLRRGAEPGAMPQYIPQYAPPASFPSGGGSPSVAPAAPPGGAEADEDSKLHKIKSPMVGTFYAAPAKGAKPFITVGMRVEDDSDVCIVEAMKVFNNIKAECRGTVVKILAQDSQPVEFGQVLFLVKTE